MASIRVSRSVSVLAAGAMLISALGACGSDDVNEPGGDHRLTEEQAKTALLTQANFGEEYRTVDGDNQEESDDLGCFGDGEDGEEPPVEAETAFEKESASELPNINLSVGSYDSEADAKDALEELRDAFDGCTRVDETDAEGVRTQLAISLSDEQLTNRADEQVTVSAVGTITSEGTSYPLGLWISMSRVDNNVAWVAVADLASSSTLLDPFVTAAVKRLDDVADGDRPFDDLVDLQD